MEKQNLIKKQFMIGAIIGFMVFLFSYLKCGNTFEMCLVLFYSYILLSIIAIIFGSITAHILENNFKKSLILSTSIPIGILFFMLVLDPKGLLNLRDVLVQFYLSLLSLIGWLISLIITKLKNLFKDGNQKELNNE